MNQPHEIDDLKIMRDELLALIRDIVVTGEVRLSSGEISDFYIDMRRLTLDPKASYLIANLIGEKLENVDFEAIGGLTIGADPIVGAYCYHAALGRKLITGFLVRKEAKGHGMKKQIEGPELKPQSKIVLIDDVVTSGASTEIAYQAVKEAGHTVVKAMALVDREEGAREKIESLGIEFETLFTKSEIVQSE